MAFYDYKCKKCDTIFEIEKGIHEEAKELACPNCNSLNVFRLFSGIKQGRSASESFNSVASTQSGSCSTCSDGVCSKCPGH